METVVENSKIETKSFIKTPAFKVWLGLIIFTFIETILIFTFKKVIHIKKHCHVAKTTQQ